MTALPYWPAAEGCVHCGVGRSGHARRSWPPPSYHVFAEPPRALVQERVRARLVDAGKLPAGEHILVVTGEGESHELDYAIECPGVTGRCRMWRDCHWCHARTDGEFDSWESTNVVAHGMTHRYIGDRWMVPTEECFVRDNDDLGAVAGDLGLKPGRYAVDHDSGDGTELILFARHPIVA
ncbi:hypothetical protein [Micromonospora sp. NPDC005652]|uniref:hypothetical protein n=1 Tax=Micromonospora sp. NPDC005652 TaxID=3157046 RepID=UPI0033C4568F